jgi:hypothetical protein
VRGVWAKEGRSNMTLENMHNEEIYDLFLTKYYLVAQIKKDVLGSVCVRIPFVPIFPGKSRFFKF